jgi:competence protein ComEC
VARAPATDTEFIKFAETMRQRNVPVNLLGAGDVIQIGEITISVVWPPLNDSLEAPSRNNDSMVLRIDYVNRSIVMTGDIEREAEEVILNSGVPLQSDVVKVPHHGSKTSSTAGFVHATQPCLAVISVGLHSMFGHPRPEVVERWRAGGAEVMTTGQNGTITVSTDGKDLLIDTFIK